MALDPDHRAKFYTPDRSAKISKSGIQNYKDNPERAESLRRRMAVSNPMNNEASKIKSREALIRMGHKPPVRGGNGTGPTKAESAVKELVPDLQLNVIVCTGMKTGSGFPRHYKLDLGIPELKFGVEADGSSHQMLSRKEQDAKKCALLSTLGWTVLRFSNRQIFSNPELVRASILSHIPQCRS